MPVTKKAAPRPKHPRPKHPRNATATRERVLAIAEASFARRGLDGASLEDIAAEAGVRKATLFYYFDSKDVLYAEVARRVALRFVPLASVFARPASLDALDEAVRALHDITEAHREGAVLLLREAIDARGIQGDRRGRRGEHANSLVGPFIEGAEAWIAAGQKKGELDATLAARSVVTLVCGAVTLPFLNPGLFPPDREAAVQFVRRAMRPGEKGKRR